MMYYLMVKTVYDVFSSSDAKERKDRETDGRRDRLIRNAFCNGVAQQRCRLSGVNTSCYRCDAVSGVSSATPAAILLPSASVCAAIVRRSDRCGDAPWGRQAVFVSVLAHHPSVRPSVSHSPSLRSARPLARRARARAQLQQPLCSALFSSAPSVSIRYSAAESYRRNDNRSPDARRFRGLLRPNSRGPADSELIVYTTPLPLLLLLLLYRLPEVAAIIAVTSSQCS